MLVLRSELKSSVFSSVLAKTQGSTRLWSAVEMTKLVLTRIINFIDRFRAPSWPHYAKQTRTSHGSGGSHSAGHTQEQVLQADSVLRLVNKHSEGEGHLRRSYSHRQETAVSTASPRNPFPPWKEPKLPCSYVKRNREAQSKKGLRVI